MVEKISIQKTKGKDIPTLVKLIQLMKLKGKDIPKLMVWLDKATDKWRNMTTRIK